jgi:hypothetical protein
VRRLRWVGLALVSVLAAASVSIHTSRTFEVTDAQGQPVVAYLAYRYQGSTSNFVHPVTYDASELAIAAGTPDGRITLPAAIHPHLPFPIQTRTRLYVDMVYVPTLHNGLGAFGADASSRPDVFAFDPVHRRLTSHDVGERPELWEQTLSRLSSTIHRIVLGRTAGETPLRERDPRTADLALELIGHFQQEFRAFLERYGNTPIPRPAPPEFGTDADKRQWTEMLAAGRAKRPTFSARYRRRYESDAAAFEKYEAELR